MDNTVLIVEDDIPTCALWRRHLEHWGWQVRIVASAEEAEALIESFIPTAVILDVMLSDRKTGWDFLAKLRSKHHTKQLPVFVVSAVDEPRRAKLEGATGFMLKPCSAHVLVSRIVEQLTLDDPDLVIQ